MITKTSELLDGRMGAVFSDCERCERYARAWGWGGLEVCNLFAFRATNPSDMKAEIDPVGRGNDAAILEAAQGAGVIVCAWGNHGAHMGRAAAVVELLTRKGTPLHCLKVTGAGEPGHPLYLRKDLKPVEYRIDSADADWMEVNG